MEAAQTIKGSQLNDPKASAGEKSKIDKYNSYYPTDWDVRDLVDTIKPVDSHSELANKVAKYIVGQMLDGRKNLIDETLANTLQQAELNIKATTLRNRDGKIER